MTAFSDALAKAKKEREDKLMEAAKVKEELPDSPEDSEDGVSVPSTSLVGDSVIPSNSIFTGKVNLIEKNGLISVTKTWKEGKNIISEEMKDDKIDVKPFYSQPALVQMDLKSVINMGNFETVHVGISVTLPGYPEELRETYLAAKEFVNMELNKEVQQIKDYRKQKLSKGE